MLTRTRVIRAVVAAFAAVSVAGCSSPSASPSPSASQSSSASASTAPSASVPSVVAIPKPPRADTCYALTLKQLAQPTNGSPASSCSSGHDTQTFYVGTLDTTVAGHNLAIDSPRVQRQLEQTCPRELGRYLGDSGQTLDLSRFHTVWFSPTLTQSEQGASWFRCDLIAFGHGDKLAALPPPGKLKGALASSSSLDRFGLCGTAAPGARGFSRVICSEKHSWKALSTIGLSGGRHYPGVAHVRDAGDSACKQQAQARSGNSLKYQYGWEWPTANQWAGGQHYGFCWVPS